MTRVDREEKIVHRYMAGVAMREVYVGYKRIRGEINRSKPVVYYVNQVYEVTRKQGRKAVTEDPQSPLLGRPLGSRGSLKEFLARWRPALKQLFEDDGVVETFRLTQGCVVEKTDGSRFQLRSFKQDEPWMRRAFNNIRRVLRSPFRD